jgi:ribosomal protein L21E
MPTFEPGDRVRVDITDTTDPDFDWHGEHGTVVDVLEDDAHCAKPFCNTGE